MRSGERRASRDPEGGCKAEQSLGVTSAGRHESAERAAKLSSLGERRAPESAGVARARAGLQEREKGWLGASIGDTSDSALDGAGDRSANCGRLGTSADDTSDAPSDGAGDYQRTRALPGEQPGPTGSPTGTGKGTLPRTLGFLFLLLNSNWLML